MWCCDFTLPSSLNRVLIIQIIRYLCLNLTVGCHQVTPSQFSVLLSSFIYDSQSRVFLTRQIIRSHHAKFTINTAHLPFGRRTAQNSSTFHSSCQYCLISVVSGCWIGLFVLSPFQHWRDNSRIFSILWRMLTRVLVVMVFNTGLWCLHLTSLPFRGSTVIGNQFFKIYLASWFQALIMLIYLKFRLSLSNIFSAGPSCSSDEILCKNRDICIDEVDSLCDDYDHCGDNSDESQCASKTTANTANHWIQFHTIEWKW